jgi:hypothetical protein
MLVHVVLARFPDPADAEEAERRIRGLADTIDVIRDLQVGRDVIATDLSYDVAWIIEVDSPEDLETYRVHPDHQVVVEWIREHRSDMAVCDFLR